MGNIICSAEDLPIIIAGLVREGICFETIKVDDSYEITLNGGH